MHVDMPYRTMPGEGFACFLQWHSLKDAVAVYACDAGGQQKRKGGTSKIGHLWLRIQLYLTHYDT